MMDSGILTFTEEEQYKLAILFGCDEYTTYFGQQFACNMGGFLTYKAMVNKSITAKEFFELTHSAYSGDIIEHRDIWQDCTLTDFIKIMLGNM